MALPNYEPEDVTGSTLDVLRIVLSNFSLSPLRSGKRVRDLLLGDYFNFRDAALTVLREPMDVRGLRYLVTLLWTNDMLISILGDVTLPKEQSIAIAQVATKVDTQFHIRLIRFLVTGMLEGRQTEEKSANRLLEVLGSISDGATIQGFLRQMLRHPNLRIRSKITLLVGHGGNASGAIRKILGDVDEDPRVRANALEALWSNRDPEILEIFRDMLEDPNNRVAGNAALGVYLAGDPRSIPVIRKMATHPEIPFRQTAAWIMGKTEDPRFLPDVGRLMGQPNANLRKAVFRAVGAIKSAAVRRAQSPPLLLAVTDAAQTGTGKTYIRLVLASRSAGLQPIGPTGFAVSADNKPVPQFSCTERRNAEICTAFIFPARPAPSDPLRLILQDALTGCLDRKRAADRWLILRYQDAAVSLSPTAFHMFGQTVGPVGEVARAPEKKVPLTFTAHALTLRYDVESDEPRTDNIPSVFQGISRVVNSLRVVRGPRFILALVDGAQEIESEGFDALAKAVRSSGVTVSAISIEKNSQMEQLCRESSGVFHLMLGLDAIKPAVKTLYQSFESEYLLEFASSSRAISIQAYNECAFGETTLDLTPSGGESVELPLQLMDPPLIVGQEVS